MVQQRRDLLDCRATLGLHMDVPDEPCGRRTIKLRPRLLAVLGLASAALGALAALLLAVAGPAGPAGAYISNVSVAVVFRIVVVVGGIGVAIAVFTDRSWALAVMLFSTAFLVGYLGGYFCAQTLGIWYPTR
jgi:hypothetical protein